MSGSGWSTFLLSKAGGGSFWLVDLLAIESWLRGGRLDGDGLSFF